MAKREYGLPPNWKWRVMGQGYYPPEFVVRQYENYDIYHLNRNWWRDMFVLPKPTLPGSFFFYRPGLDRHIKFPIDATRRWCCYMVSLPLGKTWTPVTFTGWDQSHDRPVGAYVMVGYKNTEVRVNLPQADVFAKSIHGRDMHLYLEWHKEDGLTMTWTHANRHDEEFAWRTSYFEAKEMRERFIKYEWEPNWKDAHEGRTEGMLAAI